MSSTTSTYFCVLTIRKHLSKVDFERSGRGQEPSREALNMLAQEQLVQIIPKKGIMVLPLTMKEIAMTFEARLLMEPYIIENYSKYIDMDKLLELEEQTNKILSSEILERKDAVIFCNIDDALHRTIASVPISHDQTFKSPFSAGKIRT